MIGRERPGEQSEVAQLIQQTLEQERWQREMMEQRYAQYGEDDEEVGTRRGRPLVVRRGSTASDGRGTLVPARSCPCLQRTPRPLGGQLLASALVLGPTSPVSLHRRGSTPPTRRRS